MDSFFVGLDIVKDKLIEINVLSPGGMERFKDIGLPPFTDYVIEAIERKLEYKKTIRRYSIQQNAGNNGLKRKQ